MSTDLQVQEQGTQPLHIQALGVYHLRDEGTLLAEFTPKKKSLDVMNSLLLYLLLTAPTAHRKEKLVELIWPGVPAKKSLSYLRQALKRLRKVLGDREEAAFFDFSQRTLRCREDAPIVFDVWRFDELYEKASQPERPRRQKLHFYRQMLDLYHGDLFTQRSFFSEQLEEWFVAQKVLRRERALHACQTLLEHAASLGDWERTIEVAESLVELDPWSEKAYSFWLTALYGLGRKQEAEALYSDYQEKLQEAFGLEPSEALQNKILDLQFGLPLQRGLSAKRKQTASRLPRGMTPFFGRERELLELERLLMSGESSLFTLRGTGGIGKTRLAVAIAKKVRSYFSSDAWFVPLERIHIPVELEWRRSGSSFYEMRELDELEEEREREGLQNLQDLLVGAIANALGLKSLGVASMEGQLLQYLKNKEMLLVLDNFEHFVECREVLTKLLAQAPEVTLLVTSRQELELEQEKVISLAGLEQPGASDPEAIFESPCVQLFLECAKRSTPSLDLSAENAHIIAEICALVDGSPLAIELAATLTGEVSCEELARQIGQKTTELSTPKHGIPERQRSMRAVFDYSWSLLGKRERWALIQCALFHGGFEKDALHKITSVSEEELERLHRKSLIRTDEAGRFSFHRLLERFAQEELAHFEQRQLESDTSNIDLLGVRQKYAMYFLRLLKVNTARKDPQGFKDGLEFLYREYDNIRNAWVWAVEVLELPILLESWEAMFDMYRFNGLYRDGKQLFAESVILFKAAQQTAPKALAKDLRFLLMRFLSFDVHFSITFGSYEEGEQKADEIMLFLAHSPDAWLEAYMLLAKGKIAMFRGQQEQAIELFSKVCALSDANHFHHFSINTLRELGKLHWMRGEYPRSVECGEKAIALCDLEGELMYKAGTLQYLSAPLISIGRYEESYQRLQESHQISSDFQNTRLEGGSLLAIGSYERSVGLYSKALHNLSKAVLSSKDYGFDILAGACLCEVSLIYSVFGLHQQAEESLFEALELLEKSKYVRGQAYACAYLIAVKLARGELAEAERYVERALPAAEKSKDQEALLHTHLHTGHFRMQKDDFAVAAEHYQEALALLEASESSSNARLEPIVFLAKVSLSLGEPQEAFKRLEPHLSELMEEELFDVFEPGRVYWSAYEILRAVNASVLPSFLLSIEQMLRKRAEQISHPKQKQSFLENVWWHRELLELAKTHASSIGQ